MSMFRKGIVPSWEDEVNSKGGEYQAALNLQDKGFEFLNELWEMLVLDMISNKFPHAKDVTGVRIVDKSRGGNELFTRLEIWTKFGEENNEHGREMKAYITSEYLEKHGIGMKAVFKTHLSAGH